MRIQKRMTIEPGKRQSPGQLRRRYIAKMRLTDRDRYLKFKKLRNKIVNQQYHRFKARMTPEQLAERKLKRQQYYQNIVKPRMQAKKCILLGKKKENTSNAEGTEPAEADARRPLWDPALVC